MARIQGLLAREEEEENAAEKHGPFRADVALVPGIAVLADTRDDGAIVCMERSGIPRDQQNGWIAKTSCNEEMTGRKSGEKKERGEVGELVSRNATFAIVTALIVGRDLIGGGHKSVVGTDRTHRRQSGLLNYILSLFKE